MYIPWQPIDVVRQGRIRWNRRKSFHARFAFFTNQTYWVAEPDFAPFVTGYGVLVSKVNYKYTGVTRGLRTIYDGLVPELNGLIRKYNIKEDASWDHIAHDPFWSGYWGYRIANDLFNRVIGRSNRAIVAASARLAESNLSFEDRIKINEMIRRSNSMICMYDFKMDFLCKPGDDCFAD